MIDSIIKYCKLGIIVFFVFILAIMPFSLVKLDSNIAYAKELDLTNFVNVLDFGAVCNDNKDDSKAINDAIKFAISNNKPGVKLNSGIYEFGLSDNAIGGRGENAFVSIIGATNFTLIGECDEQGTPTTMFLRHNPGGSNVDLTQQIYTEHCKNLTVKNIRCDTTPYYYTAANIVKVSGNDVILQICDGHPTPQDVGEMKMHLPALFDVKDGNFLEQRLVWTKEDGSDAIPVKDLGDGKLKVHNNQIAKKIKGYLKDKKQEDLILFFFQGHVGGDAFHLIFNTGDTNLTYDNIRIDNSTGFALTSEYTKNITFNNVNIEPPIGRYAVAPRDVMKLFCCSGDILLENSTFNGFEDDGQNCHGMFGCLKEVKDNKTLIFNGICVDTNNIERLYNSKIRFLNASTNTYLSENEIVSAKQIEESVFEFVLKNEIDVDKFTKFATNDFKTSIICELDEYLPTSWTVRNCKISNTYRGLKVSAQNVLIENNVFRNNVYDIYLGAENDEWWHESQSPRHIVIKNNTFINPLSKTSIDMDFHSYKGSEKLPVISDVVIENNKFYKSDIAINVRDASFVYIYDNYFNEDVKEQIKLDPFTCSNIYLTNKDNAKGQLGIEYELRNKLIEEQKNIEVRNAVLITIGSISGIVIISLLIAYIVKKKRKSK